MKNNRVKELLEARNIGYTAKDTKLGETLYQCVLFRKIAKITDNFSVILIEFPFGEFKTRTFRNIKELELYIDNGGK